ncbi:TetR family transcriptional regulator [Desulfocurvibacter africanus]|nr:TetR family transcriptional regulator [Desulfocurvibacter africanus]
MTYPKGQEAKERILKAAITEFARKGYHAATTQEIGRQAGANASAVN